jgi:diaminohydroxyphosphoribosylaminopyrimidine deaminase/5-amino-6-(5-phosphoribosylamino)uracil reductase
VDEAVLLRAPTSIGVDGIDALEGRPLEALTRSLVLTGSETVGADTMERYQGR